MSESAAAQSPRPAPAQPMGSADFGRLGRCLITGATGEIGSHCVRRLNQAGVRPAVLLRRSLPPEAWQGSQVEVIEGDLEEALLGPGAAGLCRALSEADTVIHLAARVNLSGRGAEEMERINYRAAVALFDLARACGVGRYVHVSTTGAVGCAWRPEPLDESAPYNLDRFNNPYFRTKRRAEREILARAQGSETPRQSARPGAEPTQLVIVNPSVTIGPQGSFRRMARRRHRRLPRPGAAWLKALQFYWSGGLNLVDVRDAAEGILLAALHGRPGTRYILGGENLTFHELMLQIHAIFGTGYPRFRLPLWALRGSARTVEAGSRLSGRRSRWTPALARLLGPYWYYDSALARSALGFAPRPLERTLRDVQAWWLERVRLENGTEDRLGP